MSQEELEAELAAELASYGLDPAAQQLSDSQLEAAMAQLERRRGEARAAMSASDRQRMDYMRCTAAWHVQRVGGGEGPGRQLTVRCVCGCLGIPVLWDHFAVRMVSTIRHAHMCLLLCRWWSLPAASEMRRR